MLFLFYVILLVYIIITAFDYFLDYLNFRHLTAHGTEVPDEFIGHIDEGLLEKTRDYTVDKIKFGFIDSIFDNILTIIFFFCGLLSIYNSWIKSLGLGFILTGIVFFLILSYIKTIFEIPFSLYSTFKIEKKYGFNTMTSKLWIIDTVKSLVISTILSLVLISVSLLLIEKFPNIWWLLIWIFFFIFSIFIMYIAPYVIETLFNKFTPLENEELEEKIKDTLAKAGIKISRIFKMDASKRTKHSNAYFTGIGHVKRIVLYDTLLEQMEDDEIVSVLAHEAGHWKKKHVIKFLIIFEILSLVGAYIAFLILKYDYLNEIFGITEGTFFSKLVILGLVVSLVTWPLSPLMNLLSRYFEKQADDFTFNITGTGKHLITSLVKLTKENLSNLHPHHLYAIFHYSHPPVVERIKYLKSLATKDTNNH